MTSFKKHIKNMKDDIKEGMQKVGNSVKEAGNSVKDTAMDLRDEAMGMMENVEEKGQELMDEYKEDQYRRSMKKQAEEEARAEYRDRFK